MDNQPAAPAPAPAPITAGRSWFRLGSVARLENLGQNLPTSTAPSASAAPTATQATAPPLLRPTQVLAARISESQPPPPPQPPAPLQAQRQPSPPPPPPPPQPPAPLQAQRQPSPPPPPSPQVPPQVQPSAPPSIMTSGTPLREESQQAPKAQPLQSSPLPPPPPQSPIRRALSRSPTPAASPRVVNPPPSRTPPESPRFRQLPPIKTPPPSESPRIHQLQPVDTSPPPTVLHPEPEPNSQKVSTLKNSYADMRGPPSPPKKEEEAHKGTEMSSEWKKNKKKEADEGKLKMITMAGENMGAYMELGSQPSHHVNRRQQHGHHKPEESHSEDGKSKKEKGKKKTEGKPIEAVVNSNVQNMNNSIFLSSSCTTHSPGVHMAILRRKQETKQKGGTSH